MFKVLVGFLISTLEESKLNSLWKWCAWMLTPPSSSYNCPFYLAVPFDLEVGTVHFVWIRSLAFPGSPSRDAWSSLSSVERTLCWPHSPFTHLRAEVGSCTHPDPPSTVKSCFLLICLASWPGTKEMICLSLHGTPAYLHSLGASFLPLCLKVPPFFLSFFKNTWPIMRKSSSFSAEVRGRLKRRG